MALIIKKQEQQYLKSELEAEYQETTYTLGQEGAFGQFVNQLRSLPARIYLFEQLRGNSNVQTRDVMVAATNAAHQRYRWYDASFKTIIFDDIVNSILKPLIFYVNEQRKALDGLEHDLEIWYNRNENQDHKYRLRDQLWFEHIRPYLSESSLIEAAIASGTLNLEYAVEQVLKKVFKRWPSPNDEVTNLLATHLKQEVMDTFTSVGNMEHLAERLWNPKLTSERQLFLSGAECLLNFTLDGNQEIIPNLESIDLLGYGIDRRQQTTTGDIERVLLEFFKKSTSPTLVPTDISDEMVLIKTKHRIVISSLRTIYDMQHSYMIMNTVRRTPYLHIDNTFRVRASYKPLAKLEVTPSQIIENWQDMADILENTKSQLADSIRDIVIMYKQTTEETFNERNEIDNEQHAFFDFVNNLRACIIPLNPTPPITQALMILTYMEEILFADGWIKIEPVYNDRFDPELHLIYRKEKQLTIKPNRVIETVKQGYSRQHFKKQKQIHRATVIISA
jgi:molecular chaperone GrpE (heat shock protein)